MKMQKRIFLAGGFFFTCIAGTLLHFVYEWSGGNFLVGLAAPVNESTWEHLKMLFFPTLVWMLGWQIFSGKSVQGLWAAGTAGISAGMLTVVTFFYTYAGVLGRNWLPLDVFSFFLGVFVIFFVVGKKWNGYADDGWQNRLASIALVLLALCFFLFSCWRLPIGLFKEPAL